MKKYFRILPGAFASFLVFSSLAQEPRQTAAPGETSRERLTDSKRTGQFGPAEKASKIIGMEVKNLQNEKLGKVDELAVDLESGRIALAVISVGGFLGIGDTLVAVPPSALHYDVANKVIHLDADKEKLKAAPRFETTKWDEYSQPHHLTQVYSYYGQQPYSGDGQTVRTDRTREANHPGSTESRLGSLQKGSKVIGMAVKNNQNEKLGKVDNFMVDLPAGRIMTVIVSSGGFLGLGDELSAVPPTALRYNPERDTVMLDTTKDALTKAPHFKSSEWPNFADSSYANEVYRAYNVEPYTSANSVANVDNTGRNVRDRDNQTLTPGDQGTSPADVDLTKRIRQEITGSKGMSVSARNVKIITTNGRVTLRGPVKTAQEKQLIGDIASRIAQPSNVDNQLEVKLSPTGRD